MKIISHQIKGKGRGKNIGFPTVNLAIPEGFKLLHGIYSAYVTINQKKYPAAMHFGPVPTFEEEKDNLEVFLIDVKPEDFPPINSDTVLEVDIKNRIREVRKFNSIQDLKDQIDRDVKVIKSLLLHDLS